MLEFAEMDWPGIWRMGLRVSDLGSRVHVKCWFSPQGPEWELKRAKVSGALDQAL